MSWHRGARPNLKRWRVLRLAILDRDGWRCRKCGRAAGRFEVDHVIPLDRGGAMYEESNLQTLCRGCHILKSAGERTYPNPERDAWKAYLAE